MQLHKKKNHSVFSEDIILYIVNRIWKYAEFSDLYIYRLIDFIEFDKHDINITK